MLAFVTSRVPPIEDSGIWPHPAITRPLGTHLRKSGVFCWGKSDGVLTHAQTDDTLTAFDKTSLPFLSRPYNRGTMAADEQGPSAPLRLTRIHIFGIALVSIIYFADIFLKAKEKCYWFDELCTVYLCRLPSFSSIWTAVLHGADFNPPLFYLLTRGAQRLFGPGLIATRLPATVGVWLFGLCLFLFVARRAGVICGFIAGVFPFFTLAQYYAYEARAHGLILGWCGLALLCWQRNAEGRAKYLWLVGFSLSLLGALLTHVYAVYLFVPFALVEFYNIVKKGRPNWGIVCAILLTLIPVVAVVYLPLFRMYRSTVPAGFFVPPHELFQGFLLDAIGPALSILLLSLILFGLEGIRRTSVAAAKLKIPKREMLVAARIHLHSSAWVPWIQAQSWPLHRSVFSFKYRWFCDIPGFRECSATGRLLERKGIGYLHAIAYDRRFGGDDLCHRPVAQGALGRAK